MDRPVIVIEGRVYHRNPGVDRYQIPLRELGDLPIRDVPPNSHLEITELPRPDDTSLEFYAVNDGSGFSIYGGPTVPCSSIAEANRIATKMRHLFLGLRLPGATPSLHFTVTPTAAHGYIGVDFSDAPDTRVRDIFEPIARMLRRLGEPSYRLFICHASEDKHEARKIARSLKGLEADVWLDEWEIQVGDSIVQKINEALSSITHLIVLLSEVSCKKPWVAKEWSAALMRQLSDNSILVLPVRLDDCVIPTILADLRYADCRLSLRRGLSEIKRVLSIPQMPRGRRNGEHSEGWTVHYD
jgi:TIR domain